MNSIIVSCYDIIMKIVRTMMLRGGMDASGYVAHEAEVSFLGELDFSDEEIYFLDRIRYFRNGILYYGKRFDKEYADKVLKFLGKVKRVLK